MLYYTGLLFLVIAVSIDGFGVGITYGMRKIRVPLAALLIIMMCSGVIVLISMTIGGVLSMFISPEVTQTLGGCILIGLGLFSLFNLIRSHDLIGKTIEQHEPRQNIESSNSRIQHWKTVMQKPHQADLDKSGAISLGEAFILGSALALDAFGAGIGAAIIGYSPLITALLIAFMSGLLLFLGINIGMLLSKNKRLKKMSFLPPLLLITLGVLNIV